MRKCQIENICPRRYVDLLIISRILIFSLFLKGLEHRILGWKEDI